MEAIFLGCTCVAAPAAVAPPRDGDREGTSNRREIPPLSTDDDGSAATQLNSTQDDENNFVMADHIVLVLPPLQLLFLSSSRIPPLRCH